MGAIAITNKQELGGGVFGIQSGRAVRFTATFSDDYATGGDSLSLGTLGLRHLEVLLEVINEGRIAGRVGVEPEGGFKVHQGGTAAAPTLVATEGGDTPAEVTATTDLSTFSVELIAIGYQ